MASICYEGREFVSTAEAIYGSGLAGTSWEWPQKFGATFVGRSDRLVTKATGGLRRVMLWLVCEWRTWRGNIGSGREFSATVACVVLSMRQCCLCGLRPSFPCKLARSVWSSIRIPL